MTPHLHEYQAPHNDNQHNVGLSEMLDLGAEVLHDYLADVTSWLHSLAPASCERTHPLRVGRTPEPA